MPKIKVAVLGATGSVGQKFIQLLEDHPYFDIELWNKTKGEFCKNEKIDIHFDDTEEYEKYFDKYITTFILII